MYTVFTVLNIKLLRFSPIVLVGFGFLLQCFVCSFISDSTVVVILYSWGQAKSRVWGKNEEVYLGEGL